MEKFMRRPLSLICFVFLVVIVLYTQYGESSTAMLSVEEGSYLLIGKIQDKQINQDQAVLYLEGVTIYPSNTSYEVAFSQHELKQTQTYTLIAYCNEIEGKKTPKIGSTILLSGSLKAFRIATNYGEFHQANYQQSEGYNGYITGGILLASGSAYSMHGELVFQMKESLMAIFEQYLPSNEAGIMKAMLLGDKSDLDDTIKYLYQKNGIIHVLAISGLHISMIGMGINQLLKRTPLPLGATSCITMILLSEYVYMTGSSTSGLRAVSMFGIYLFALWNRRSYDIITAMSVSYVFLLLRNPYAIYQVGFQLSFGAIIAIGLLVPVLEELLPMQVLHIQERGSVFHLFYQGFLLSCGVQIMTLPILISAYYEYPITSIFLNLIIVPTVGIAVVLGILLIMFSYFSGLLAGMCGTVLTYFLQCYESICTLVLMIPGQLIPLAMVSPIQIIVYYLGIIAMLYLPKKWRYSIGIKWCVLVCILFIIVWNPNDTLRITMIDVGQGDGILIQTPTGNAYLMDGGSTSNRGVGTYQILPTLKYYGIREIEVVFISHMDYDHYSGILELLELQLTTGEVQINHVVVACNADEEKLAQMKELIIQCGISLHYVERGFSLRDGDVEFHALMPYAEYRADSENENSLTLRVTYGTFDMLCTGDLEKAAEDELLRLMGEGGIESTIDYEILKVGHHGSNNATSTPLLEQIKAEVAIISCGRNNMYGHPHPDVLERLESAYMEIYNTAEVGAVVIECDGKDYEITTFLNYN